MLNCGFQVCWRGRSSPGREWRSARGEKSHAERRRPGCRREGGRDLRIANVRDVGFAVGHDEVVNVGVKSFADLRGGAGKIDDEAVDDTPG